MLIRHFVSYQLQNRGIEMLTQRCHELEQRRSFMFAPRDKVWGHLNLKTC